MLASLNSQHSLRSAVGLNTFKPQHNLLCSFSLFLEYRLSLPTIATLLPVIRPLSLGIQRLLALLVLCHFVGLVIALLGLVYKSEWRRNSTEVGCNRLISVWAQGVLSSLQKVQQALGTFTMFARVLSAQKERGLVVNRSTSVFYTLAVHLSVPFFWVTAPGKWIMSYISESPTTYMFELNNFILNQWNMPNFHIMFTQRCLLVSAEEVI